MNQTDCKSVSSRETNRVSVAGADPVSQPNIVPCSIDLVRHGQIPALRLKQRKVKVGILTDTATCLDTAVLGP